MMKKDFTQRKEPARARMVIRAGKVDDDIDTPKSPKSPKTPDHTSPEKSDKQAGRSNIDRKSRTSLKSPKSPRSSKRQKPKRKSVVAGAHAGRFRRHRKSTRHAAPIAAAASLTPHGAVDHVRLPDGRELSIYGATSRQTGRQYVCVRDHDREVWTPRSDWAGSSREALGRLAAHNIVIVGSPNNLREAVAALDSFPTRTVIDCVGWTEGRFTLPTGEIVRTDRDDVLILLPDCSDSCGQAGTLEGWQEALTPLIGHALPTFYLAAAFAAPLLPLAGLTFNPGFEATGQPGCGNTTLMQLVASVAGPAFDGAARRYMIGLGDVANGSEAMLAQFRHMPLVTDNAALFMPSASDQTRTAGAIDIINRHALGRAKGSQATRDQLETPFVWFVSSDAPGLARSGSINPSLQHALCDRLISTPIKGVKSVGDLEAQLLKGIDAHHGVALRAFIERLVADHADGADALRARIRQRMHGFARKVGAAGPPMPQVVQAFALVYAAGRLAQDYRVLPAGLRCGPGVLNCYNQHMLEGRPCPRLYERLLRFAQHPDVIDLNLLDGEALTKKRLSRAPAFWRTNRQGEREFWIPSKTIRRRFPDWSTDPSDFDVQRIFRPDKNRAQKKRAIPRLGKQWVYCFVFGKEP